ncbi:uncharacterized protein LOC116305862, partial [Actinia tenebrosa]|uniref:Uncharacterized protein LOC116305862 n=1 Tax=Actinia tenebrosa TaxID=6105 RepID=A0A6P8IX77_ACTTE
FVCVALQCNAVSFDINNIVTTTAGPIRGKFESLSTGKQAWKFLGIPFAKAKRFENPTDPDKWTAARDATKFGKRCPQPYYKPGPPLSGLSKASEECLFINIFVPGQKTKNSSEGLAVMVWIHGGAYVFGTGSSSLYDGGVLATEEGVLVVTFNYRLGALGFLSTGSESDLKGNYAMLDQVHALKWVKKNIRR